MKWHRERTRRMWRNMGAGRRMQVGSYVKRNPVNGLVAINLHCSRRHGPWPMENQCSCDSNPLYNPPIATTPRTYLISTSEMPTKLICGLNRDMVKAMFSFPRTLSGRKRANGILFASLYESSPLFLERNTCKKLLKLTVSLNTQT